MNKLKSRKPRDMVPLILIKFLNIVQEVLMGGGPVMFGQKFGRRSFFWLYLLAEG